MSAIDDKLSQVSTLIKTVQERVAELDVPEAKHALMTARESVADVREELIALRAGARESQLRVEELEEALRLKPSLMRHQGVYWTAGDGEPWCPSCWEGEHRAVHLNPTDILAGRLAVCRHCNYSVNLDNVSVPKASAWKSAPD